MLNHLIFQKVGAWFQREDCVAKPIITYIQEKGFLRDAQIEAIKTYLFLKIEGANRPLWQLFCDGFFVQNEDLASLHISETARAVFESDKSARALFEFSRVKAEGGPKTLLPDLETYLRDHAAELTCDSVIKRMFYGVEYPDYLFSLPMGAGKTFLMAAFIYLDLYFAQNEPDNKAFAHNFVLLVPSGLKSSIIPSLKTIENFDPAWVLPEPAASSIRQLIKFEILDQPKSGSKSNKARNPNAQKISEHQPFEELMGLVLVTNAEKVVLDKVQLDESGRLFEQTDDEKDKAANELRNLIGKIPNLQILIDEVHHAATDDIKLRQVVNRWSAGGSINSVLGFSGTPYLSSPEPVAVAEGVSLKFPQITNTVFYYPLAHAIMTFLKKPRVHTLSGLQSPEIVRRGVREFLETYGETVYDDDVTAKLAIYCGTIERLEEDVFPMLVGEMGISPDDILKYHRGNKDYKISADAEREWKSLDTHLSRKKIILLVQIGKEGWDCRSLTGVILSQKGDCPANMTLQTSCRCLRQMNGGPGTAGIWLNSENAKTLDKQLQEEQHTSIAELNTLGKGDAAPTRARISRIDALALPPMDFYQLRVHFDMETTSEADPPAAFAALDPKPRTASVKTRVGLDGANDTQRFLDDERGEPAEFSAWLLHVVKGSFGTLTCQDLRLFETTLRAVFERITYKEADGACRFNTLYDADALAAQIRLAFYAPRAFSSREEIVPKPAHLLVVEKLNAIAASTKNLYPDDADIAQMQTMDVAGQTAEEYTQAQKAQIDKIREFAAAQGYDTNLFAPRETTTSVAVQNKDRSFHFAPYNFDSLFELDFLKESLIQNDLRPLEIYFNGVGELTEFRIDCYAQKSGVWNKVGKYTPDFLLLERRDGQIYRALIVETKGKGFASQPEFVARRAFVQDHFLPLNNNTFGYKRFEYLYLSDADPLDNNLHKLCKTAQAFFEE